MVVVLTIIKKVTILDYFFLCFVCFLYLYMMCFWDLLLLVIFRYQVLAVAAETKSKEDAQNLTSGKRVTVR